MVKGAAAKQDQRRGQLKAKAARKALQQDLARKSRGEGGLLGRAGVGGAGEEQAEEGGESEIRAGREARGAEAAMAGLDPGGR